MAVEDNETLKMFVEESQEHLEDIEENLLAIENAGENFDIDLLNKVFRAAHSIKGGAGFMGLAHIKELAHKTENVLGMMRSREISPGSEVVSTLLVAFDTLKLMINDVEKSEQIDIREPIASLVDLAGRSLDNDRKNSVSDSLNISLPEGKILFQASRADIDQAKKEGKSIYLVECDLIQDIHQKSLTPVEVVNSLAKSGTIIDSKIDFESVGNIDDEIQRKIPFYILFASAIETEIISSLLDIEEKFVRCILQDKSAADLQEVTVSVCDTEQEGPVADKDVSENIQNSVVEPEVTAAQTSLRVNVSLLDRLMSLAGELVLSRNHLLQGLATRDIRGLEISSQRIGAVTSELQEAIMCTRMQPIANVFNKFPRVVRDLSRDLGKKASIIISGKNVELDKTIIEAINDPLTHLIRNAVDHGIESPEQRQKSGKNPAGEIKLSAFHKAGQVNIEISDDGKGMDGSRLAASAVKKGLISENQARLMSEKEKIALIFLPGLSTADEVSDVSGRGVGMDVVRTNLDKLGGIIDIDSFPGKGTEIRIKLPLTLAIIPSQIITSGQDRYAIPQVNLDELLRIPAAQIKKRVEKIGDAEVVRLRGMLLPLLDLAAALDIEKTYIDPDAQKLLADRRENIADRRSKSNPLFEAENKPVDQDEDMREANHQKIPRKKDERRVNSKSALNIAVVSAGSLKYGLIVEKLCDSEEIVVKPLGRHLKTCSGYAGATIMGDGKVVLILDIVGLAHMSDLTSLEGTDRVAEVALRSEQMKDETKNKASLLIFRNGEEEQFSLPLGLVERIEKIKTQSIEDVGGKKVIQYRGASLPLFSLDEVANVKPLSKSDELEIIVFKLSKREIGLLVMPPVDVMDVDVKIDSETLKQPGIMGSSIICERTTLMVDIFDAVKTLNPEWFDKQANGDIVKETLATVLFAEDSEFFRNQVKGFMQDAGFRVIAAVDGAEAFEILDRNFDEIDIIVTDIEMPNIDGFELASKVKSSEKFSNIKIIALTSLAGEDDIARGLSSGIDDYQIKMDREKLILSIERYLKISDE